MEKTYIPAAAEDTEKDMRMEDVAAVDTMKGDAGIMNMAKDAAADTEKDMKAAVAEGTTAKEKAADTMEDMEKDAAIKNNGSCNVASARNHLCGPSRTV